MAPSLPLSRFTGKNGMTDNELVRLHQNPFYIQADEFFMQESGLLLDLLERTGWNPVTTPEWEAIKLHCERAQKARLTLEQIRELVFSSSQTLPSALAKSVDWESIQSFLLSRRRPKNQWITLDLATEAVTARQPVELGNFYVAVKVDVAGFGAEMLARYGEHALQMITGRKKFWDLTIEADATQVAGFAFNCLRVPASVESN
jgi:hypothetical protein